jgi:hypothetical protein
MGLNNQNNQPLVVVDIVNAINMIDNDDNTSGSDGSDGSDGDDWYSGYQNWETESKPIHATIQTIVDIPIGNSQVFLCLDRNVLDSAGDVFAECYESDTEVLPSNVFGAGYHIKFTKIGEGLTGTFIVANSLDEIDDEDPDDDSRTDFDIEYIPNHWFPMENGSLPANDWQGFAHLSGVAKSWTTFDPSTRLGWRGPMIPLERIDEYLIKFK